MRESLSAEFAEMQQGIEQILHNKKYFHMRSQGEKLEKGNLANI